VDAVELLAHDHRMVEQLFRDYDSAASSTQKKGVVDILVRELSKHAALEELLVLPLAQKALPDGRRRAQQQLEEHLAVKNLLVRLDGASPDDAGTDELIRQLQQEIGRHVESQEGDLLPALRAEVDQQALDELGREVDEGKRTAPTRPHPHAPDQPPVLTWAAPVAAIYDRMRDRLQGWPRT